MPSNEAPNQPEAATSPGGILVAGEALIDLISQPDGSYLPVAGGSLLNVAVACQHLGTPTELHTRLSTDALSNPIRQKLQHYGVGQRFIAETTDPTTLAIATIGDNGGASYSFYVTGTANVAWQPSDLPPATHTPQALHIGSFVLSLEPAGSVLRSYTTTLWERGNTTITFDPNIRLGMGQTPTAEAARVLAQLSTVHLVKASDEDLETLFPDTPAEDIISGWAVQHGITAILTRGSAGVLLVRPDGTSLRVPSHPAHPLIDTVGAGDTFWGAILSELDRRGVLGSDAHTTPTQRLTTLSDADWIESLTFAAAAAALVCQQAGAVPPTRAEVDAALATRRSAT